MLAFLPPFRGRAIVWLGLLLVASRLLLVLSLADVWFYGEELEKGTAAKAMLDGLGLQHYQYAYHYYEGGGFLVSHLKALAFLAVGENVLAHKVVALVTTTAVFAAGYSLVRQAFTERAAWIFGLLFVFAPETWIELSLLSLGIHFEASLFVFLILASALRLLQVDSAASKRELATLGFAGGLGLYFSYQMALVLVYVGVVLALRRRDLVVSRRAWVAVGAFVLGAAPLLWMAANVGWAVLDVHGSGLASGGEGFSRLQAFVRSVYAEPQLGEVVYPVAYLLACVWLVGRGAARRSARLLVGFLLFWGAAYVNSAFVVNADLHAPSYTRFAPVWALCTVLLAGALDLGFSGGRVLRCTSGFVLGSLLLLGCGSLVAACRDAAPSTPKANLVRLMETKGYDYSGYFAKLWSKLEGDDEQRLRCLLRFDETERSILRADLAEEAFRQTSNKARLLTALRVVDPGALEDFARGLGRFVIQRGTAEYGERNLINTLRAARQFPDPLAERLIEGFGRIGLRYAVQPGPIRSELESLGDFPELAAYLRGVGYRIYRRLVLGPFSNGAMVMRPDKAREFIERLPAPYRPHLLAGFEEALRLHTFRGLRSD